MPLKSCLDSFLKPAFWYSFVEVITSDATHPALQMSIPESYDSDIRMISGARYHRDTTWGVNLLFLFFLCEEDYSSLIVWMGLSGCLESGPLENPKSEMHILKSDGLISRFAGLMSLCITLAECMKKRAQSIEYINLRASFEVKSSGWLA